MTRVILPPWNDAMSDGCSVPSWLRPFFKETPEVRAACVRHDEAYYYGGTRGDRLAADARLLIGWLEAGMDAEAAERGFLAVRVGGDPRWKTPGVSWAFGGNRFVYDKEE